MATRHRLSVAARAAAAIAAAVALAVVGLQLPASAVLVAGAPDRAGCVDRATPPPAAARGAGRRVGRGPDHPPVSTAEQVRVEARAERLVAARRALLATRITVPVQVHVMRAADGVTGEVTDEQVAEQIAVLNAAYRGADSPDAADTGFRFVLKGTERIDNDAWHVDEQSQQYRADTRIGGRRTLNIWFVAWTDGTLGIATFPWSYRSHPAVDGVRVHFDSVPGGGLAGFDLGHTTTHEVGHWLGLFHTFQGKCGKVGDQVSDTPPERSPTFGCPARRNSCPDRPGLDPIHNFMDYSDDACMTQFTPGQKQRLRQMWRAYRA